MIGFGCFVPQGFSAKVAAEIFFYTLAAAVVIVPFAVVFVAVVRVDTLPDVPLSDYSSCYCGMGVERHSRMLVPWNDYLQDWEWCLGWLHSVSGLSKHFLRQRLRSDPYHS